MGYESKIYFCKEYSFPEPIHHSDIVAYIDMSKMGYESYVHEFLQAFDTPTPFSIRVEDYNDELDCECMKDVIEDKYGARLCYAFNKDKLYELARKMQKQDGYWRFEKLTEMIKIFKDNDDVYIVHYGY